MNKFQSHGRNILKVKKTFQIKTNVMVTTATCVGQKKSSLCKAIIFQISCNTKEKLQKQLCNNSHVVGSNTISAHCLHWGVAWCPQQSFIVVTQKLTWVRILKNWLQLEVTKIFIYGNLYDNFYFCKTQERAGKQPK